MAAAVANAVAADPGVLSVGDPVFNQAGDTAIITVIPRTSPSSPDTEDLVHRLRDDVLHAGRGVDRRRRLRRRVDGQR